MDNGANHGQGSTGRHRPGEEVLPPDGGGRGREGGGTEEAAAGGAAVVPGAAAGGLRGGDGSMRPARTTGAGWRQSLGHRCDADEPAQGGAVHAPQQERRRTTRTGSPRRRAGRRCVSVGCEVGGATAHAAVAPGASAGGAGPQRRKANQLHGFLLEYGIESPKRASGRCCRRLPEVLEDAENELPPKRRGRCCCDLGGELRYLDGRVKRVRGRRSQAHAAGGSGVPAAAGRFPASARSDGHGAGGGGGGRLVVQATAASSSAWLGLVPRQHSAPGRASRRLLGISKRGDRYVRKSADTRRPGGAAHGRRGIRKTGAAE